MTTIVLETGRLILRQYTFDDAPFILALLNDASYIRNIGDKKVRTREDAKHHLMTGPMESYRQNKFGLYCVELKESRTAIGTCGLLKRDFLVVNDIGYAFLPEFRSKGYAREAVAGVLAYSKQKFSLSEIAAIVNPDNSPSIRLLENLGFYYKKTIRLPDTQKEVRLYISDGKKSTAF
ncbi:MAG: GNAT family N-acetyltransferase [Desulfobacterales bacterium]|nr:GNAT family N-acetyltransferase [Desulfobacterales bacterium]